METLKYKVITSAGQYLEYCKKLKSFLEKAKIESSREIEDEIHLLTTLIEKYDEEQHPKREVDPIRKLKFLMENRSIKAVELAKILGVSQGLVSDILKYKKGLSKDVIRKLAEYFRVRQEGFNRPYELKIPVGIKMKKKEAVLMNGVKSLRLKNTIKSHAL